MEQPYNHQISQKNRLLPWFMWSLAALFYCYETLLQVSPGVMVPDLMQAFSATAGQLGLLAAVYFYAYASMQIPVGILIDRLGPRRLLTIAALTCGVGALIFSFSQILLIAAFGRLLIGLGSAFAVVSCMHICATWLPLRYFATLTGVMVTMGMLGAIGGEAPLSLMVGKLGWRHTLLIFGAIGILLSMAMWLFIKDSPRQATPLASKRETRSLFTGLKLVLSNRQNLIVATYGALMYAPTTTFGGLWGVPFLMAFYQMSRPTAAALVSMLFIGWAVGSPLFGVLSDRLKRRKTPMIVGNFGALIAFLLILFVHLPLTGLGILLFILGFFSSGFLPSFSIIREINPHEINATSIGFMNAFNMLTGAILQPLVGVVLDLTWNGMMHEGIRQYSVQSFHTGLILVPLGLFIALLTLPFIKETYCRTTIPANDGLMAENPA